MTTDEIRQKFLEFFERNGHKVVPSSSLMPDDPSVLFTTAGMQQFKPYYTGAADPLKDFGSKNIASCQKCVRTSDIDSVGDESHLTFFEMLGNFSFGGYGKKEAIQLGYDFIVKELGLEISSVSIFKGDSETPADEESEKIWQEIGMKRIIKGKREDNFWGPTGNEGPCGPTTEIYIKNIDGKEIEIWNIVFNEYYKDRNGRYKKIPLGIDTGMGLERLAMILQKKTSVYGIDIFERLMGYLKEKTYNANERIIRIIADHLRAAVFMIADGFLPSNTEAGYVLRRILRRVIGQVKLIGLSDKFFIDCVKIIGDIYQSVYPEIKRNEAEIITVINNEIEKFGRALEAGIKEFKKEDLKNVTGEKAFYYYQTFGLPIDIIKDLAGGNVDEKGFIEEFKKHQEISRAGAEKKFGGHGLAFDTGEIKALNEEEIKQVTKYHTATHLLHAALRKVLGDKNISQRGSDITAERLRFDFSFPRKLTEEEKKKIEDLVNEMIKMNLSVKKEEMPYEEAIKSGALAFFKGKYPSIVSVCTIYNPENNEVFSKEICGGPHVNETGEIGQIKILKEESSSAGVRRIRAA